MVKITPTAQKLIKETRKFQNPNIDGLLATNTTCYTNSALRPKIQTQTIISKGMLLGEYSTRLMDNGNRFESFVLPIEETSLKVIKNRFGDIISIKTPNSDILSGKSTEEIADFYQRVRTFTEMRIRNFISGLTK